MSTYLVKLALVLLILIFVVEHIIILIHHVVLEGLACEVVHGTGDDL